MAKIIISYRRSDSDVFAGRVRDRIAGSFGEDSVFIDVDNIPFGKDFRVHIQEALAKADAVLVVVGPRWLGVGKGGQSRITNDTDPVRIEVETALSKGIPTIPILVGQTNMPRPEQLPESLRNFAFINAAPVDTGRDFHRDLNRVIATINTILELTPDTTEGALRSSDSTAPAQQATVNGLDAERESQKTEAKHREDEAQAKATEQQAQPSKRAFVIGSLIGAAIIAAIGVWFVVARPMSVSVTPTPSTITAQQMPLAPVTSTAPPPVEPTPSQPAEQSHPLPPVQAASSAPSPPVAQPQQTQPSVQGTSPTPDQQLPPTNDARIVNPASGEWTGAGARTSVTFGGSPYCIFKVSMQNLNLKVSIDNNGNINWATLTGTMVETIVDSCPYAPIGSKSHTYSGGGSVEGKTISLELNPASTNAPLALASFRGQIINGRLTGTLTLHRTDAAGNLAWTVQSAVK